MQTENKKRLVIFTAATVMVTAFLLVITISTGTKSNDVLADNTTTDNYETYAEGATIQKEELTLNDANVSDANNSDNYVNVNNDNTVSEVVSTGNSSVSNKEQSSSASSNVANDQSRSSSANTSAQTTEETTTAPAETITVSFSVETMGTCAIIKGNGVQITASISNNSFSFNAPVTTSLGNSIMLKCTVSCSSTPEDMSISISGVNVKNIPTTTYSGSALVNWTIA